MSFGGLAAEAAERYLRKRALQNSWATSVDDAEDSSSSTASAASCSLRPEDHALIQSALRKEHTQRTDEDLRTLGAWLTHVSMAPEVRAAAGWDPVCSSPACACCRCRPTVRHAHGDPGRVCVVSGACATYRWTTRATVRARGNALANVLARARARRALLPRPHARRRRNRCPDCPPRTPYTVLPAPAFRKPPASGQSLAALKAARQYHEEAERARKAAKKEKQPKVARTKASRLAESQLAEASEMIAMAAKGWIGRSQLQMFLSAVTHMQACVRGKRDRKRAAKERRSARLKAQKAPEPPRPRPKLQVSRTGTLSDGVCFDSGSLLTVARCEACVVVNAPNTQLVRIDVKRYRSARFASLNEAIESASPSTPRCPSLSSTRRTRWARLPSGHEEAAEEAAEEGYADFVIVKFGEKAAKAAAASTSRRWDGSLRTLCTI